MQISEINHADLSPSIHQQGMWVASQLNSHPANYNLAWSIELTGLLPSTQKIQDTLYRIVCRHDILRSVFFMGKAALIRKIIPLERVDLVIQSVAQEGALELRKRIALFGLQPFDIENGPLFRFQLLQYSQQKSVLVCCFHHLVIDGSSWALFEEEVWHYLNSKEDLLPPASYTDFAAWQKEQSYSQDWINAADYWQNQLKPHPIAWELLANIHAITVPSHSEGGKLERALGIAQSQHLLHCAKEWQTTPFRIALTAFSMLMGLYSRQEKYLLETTLVGKSCPDFKKTIGLFVNSAYLDVDLTHAPSFREMLTILSNQLDRAIDFQETPFQFALKERLATKPIGVRPFSPVSFTKLPRIRKKQSAHLAALSGRHFLNLSRHPLSVYLQQVEDNFCLSWIYSTGDYSQAKIEKLAMQFEVQLRLCLQNPHLSSSLLIPISKEEKVQALGEWNATEKNFPLHKTVHGLFEEQVRLAPERVAAISGERHFTYTQLDYLAQAYASLLKASGVKAKSFVPLLLKSSLELLIAELAVMKIGAAFAPIDPAWPKVRIKNLLSTLQAVVIVVSKSDPLPQGVAKVIRIDVDFNEAGNFEPLAPVDSENALYCIFTSGSTGTPKGAINPHRGIVNRLFAMNTLFGPAAKERILVSSPGTVDSHLWQYYWPLISGGMVVFPLAQELGIPDLLSGLINRYDITCIDITPSNFQKLIRYLNSFSTPISLDHLKYILIGGEAIIAQDVYAFQKKYPHIAIFNSYGPTETAIGTIFFQIPQNAITPIPLGKPLPNTKAVILNRALQILPPNIVGELHLGGACMGLGYLNNEEATREKFIPNPFKELDCPSLYKTGDLAYYSEEGLIYFIGRIDTQIKLHGARIDPGEIETILMQQPGISQAVVTLEHDQNGETELVAHLVFSALFTPSLRAIKDALYSKLPLYMVPTQFFQIDAIPLLSAGKIDRISLGQKTNIALSMPKGNTEIASPFEQKIIQIWLEVLQIEAIDVNDHFFVDLHCDSLGLLLFIITLDKQMQVALSTQEIYAAPTSKLLAQYILAQHLVPNK